ncbi:MAG: biopolymer transporter ExbD [Gammaproteobacteria bacterium]|nr:biopolymer transporter ExbD [Gammaproteobacteria bacterium]
MSRRARRMDKKHHKSKVPALNLVSLMDIFTILVFFLLVNSSDVETLQNNRSVQLPESIAEQKPRETVVVMITEDAILVQGQTTVALDDIGKSSATVIPELKRALQLQSERLIADTGNSNRNSREVTIMGDRTIPYRILKKVMATCTEADYGVLSLAVLQKAGGSES